MRTRFLNMADTVLYWAGDNLADALEAACLWCFTKALNARARKRRRS